MKKTRKRTAIDESSCYIDKSLDTIYIVGDITHRLASKFRRYVRYLERQGTLKIIVEINSPGGDIEAGLMMVDTINLCKAKVVTRATGQAASMASVLLACGHEREALPMSSIMVHQGTFSMRARAEEIDNEINEAKRVEDLCWKLMDERSNRVAGFWRQLCGGKNLYLTAEQCLSYGLIDKICKKE